MSTLINKASFVIRVPGAFDTTARKETRAKFSSQNVRFPRKSSLFGCLSIGRAIFHKRKRCPSKRTIRWPWPWGSPCAAIWSSNAKRKGAALHDVSEHRMVQRSHGGRGDNGGDAYRKAAQTGSRKSCIPTGATWSSTARILSYKKGAYLPGSCSVQRICAFLLCGFLMDARNYGWTGISSMLA